VATPQVHERNADQAAYWNGEAGASWVAGQDALDAILAPTLALLLDRAAVAAGERVVDIGCGCGVSALELARKVQPGGRVLGVDVSAPMLARARQRASADLPLEFTLGDATVHAFEPGWADVIVSRFGVMFFADPVLAFRNMRTGLRTGGRLAFVCWREPARNAWRSLPLQEASRFVPRSAVTDPDAPGPFAFAREARVRHVLADAGFSDIGLEAVDLELDLAMGQGLDVAVQSALEATPVLRELAGQPAEVIGKVKAAIRSALAPYLKGQMVALGASVWIVSARNAG
jgi:SAM-dependent methyltransferase